MPTIRLQNSAAAVDYFRQRGATIGPSVAEQLAAKVRDAEKPKRKPSHTPGVLNCTESAYADRLATLQRIGEVTGFAFEPHLLILGPTTDCSYKPDFLVERENGSKEYHEVKNVHVRDDSIVKLKWAAEIYTDFRFFLAKATWDKDRKIYHWKIVRIGGTSETHRKEWK